MNLQRSSIWLWECHTTSTSPWYGLHSSELLLPPPALQEWSVTGGQTCLSFSSSWLVLITLFKSFLTYYLALSLSLLRFLCVETILFFTYKMSKMLLAHTFWSITSLLEIILIGGKMVFCIQEGSSQPEHCLFSFLFFHVKLRYVPLARFEAIWAVCLCLVGWIVMGRARPLIKQQSACYLLLKTYLMEFWIYLGGMLEGNINWEVDLNVLSPQTRRRNVRAHCGAWGQRAELRGQGGGAGG